MGNSEVGHLNFGAGRIAMMDIARIDNAVHDGSLGKNQVIADALASAKKSAAAGSISIGLVSDGGVHSLLAHLVAIIGTAARGGGCRSSCMHFWMAATCSRAPRRST